jgi:hypothetical protein
MWSGIFAYYYGLSKFTQDFINFKKWKGENIDQFAYQKFQRRTILFGFTLAMILHATYDILATLNNIIPAIIIVCGMVLYAGYLLKKNTANLAFVLADRHKSVMQKNDVEVILEYIGAKYNEKSFKDVIEISHRLLKRDPDNNVAKLFQASAADKIKKQTTEKSTMQENQS